VTYVHAGAGRRPSSIPESFRQAIRNFEQTPPEEALGS
jgi:hypothetical protein